MILQTELFSETLNKDKLAERYIVKQALSQLES